MDNGQKKRILVTGGAGFIGSHLTDAFLAEGHTVAVLDDLSTGKKDNVAAAAELYVEDIRSDQAAKLITSWKPDVVVHQAAQMDVRRSTQDPVFDASVNVVGTLNLLHSAVEAGVEQVLFASTGGAIYGEQESFPATEDHPTRPVSPYGVSKLACERYLYYFHHETDLDVTCLRYANVYGERQNPHGEAGVVAIFLNRLLGGEFCTINGDGLQTRDYVYIADIVAANVAALGHSGFAVYNVGTGIETNVAELYEQLTKAVGVDKEPKHGAAKPGEQLRSVIDSARLDRRFQLPRKTDLATGLAQTASWFARRRRPTAARR